MRNFIRDIIIELCVREKYKAEEVKMTSTYDCYSCGHKYSPHLTKKCPRCHCRYLKKNIIIQVKVPATIEHFLISVSKEKI